MTAKVIQGAFLSGQPKLSTLTQAKLPPPIQTKAAARSPGPPASAFAARPPGPPVPAFAARSVAVQRHGAGGPFQVELSRLGLVNSGGRPLPDAVRGKMESALRADFSNVRVHTGPQAERIGAIAFTTGHDIYFAPGRYQPETVQGQQLLGHELAHVVQQRAGRVRNPMGFGVAVVQDRALEAEADRLGMRAAMHRGAVQAKRGSGMVQRSAPAPMPFPVSTRPGRYRMTANPADRSGRPPIGGTKPLASATKQRAFRPGSLIQRNIDSTNFEKSGAISPLYFVDRHSRQALYGRQDAPDPKPTGLYTKTGEYDDGEGQQLHKWVPNVRFLTLVERDVDIDGDKLVYRTNSGLEGEVDLKSLREYVEKVAVREGKPPTLGVLGKNDCVQFAALLYNLIAQEGLDFHEDKERLKESVERYTEKFPRIKVGQMMKHFFSQKGATCNYHGATVVAIDGKALVTLEANVDKPDLTAPEFHIHKGVSAFVRSNIGQGANKGDPIEILTHQSGNPEWDEARPASFRYEALVDPSKHGIDRTFTYYSNNIGATRTPYGFNSRIHQVIRKILSPSSDGFWKEQTPFGTAPPDGIVSMRQMINTHFGHAIQVGAQKGLGPCPSSRSRRTHTFYVLLRRYASSVVQELPEICAQFETFLQEVMSHRVAYVYPGHQW